MRKFTTRPFVVHKSTYFHDKIGVSMALLPKNLDFSEAVPYHDGQFPPQNLDYAKLITPLRTAATALARYDQMLLGMHNSEILLAPLRHKEAVISSRIEGTISTLDEVLR